MSDKVKALQDKVNELKSSIFIIDMIDRWTKADSELYDKLNNELKQVQELLAKELLKVLDN